MPQDETRTIRIRCSTWDQVQSFHEKKLKGSSLVLKLPFQPGPGDALTVALGLPSGLVFAIDGTAAKVGRNPSDGKYPVAIHLHSLTPALRDQLRELIEEGRSDGAGQRAQTANPGLDSRPSPPPPPSPPPVPPPKPIATAGPREPAVKSEPKAKARATAGKKIKGRSPTVRAIPRVPEQDERAMRKDLDTLRQRLLQSAAHEVLGIADDADLSAIREAYFQLAKKHHPDVLGLYRSPRVARAASEVFIHVNKAYDRLRAAAMRAEGNAAGPALRATPGWFIDIEDVQPAGDEGLALGSNVMTVGDPSKAEVPTESGPMGSARQALLSGQWSAAREFLVEALGGDPRNRSFRALFHVASGMQLREHGRVTESRLHFETALAHDGDCVEAQRALALEHESGDRGSVLRKIFQR